MQNVQQSFLHLAAGATTQGVTLATDSGSRPRLCGVQTAGRKDEGEMSGKKIKVEELSIEQGATSDPNNINKHTQRGRGAHEHSIRKYGAGRSIVSAGKGVDVPVVIGGNQTLEIAAQLGMRVINVHSDGQTIINVVRDDIAPGSAEFYASAIMDNEVSKISYNPDIDILAAVMADPAMQTLRDEDKMLADIVSGMQPYKLDYQKEWEGMPEFEQKDLSATKQILVSFNSMEDYQKFSKLIKQKLTEKTRSIWYPDRPIELKDQLGTKAGLEFTDES